MPETDPDLQRGVVAHEAVPGDAGTLAAVESVSPEVRNTLDELVGPLAQRFLGAGHGFYLVGGLVRDLVLGRGLTSDIDVTTDATPDQVRPLLEGWAEALWEQGARFGTIGAKRGPAMVEITTHRAERYRPESRKPDVDFSTEVRDDLSRRDFTVNAMAIELPDWTFVDPFDGGADLEAGVLRTPIDPAASFTDDPLRMLRAARFASGYHLTPTVELEAALTRYATRLGIVSRERISDEFRKLFVVERPGSGLELMHRTGVLTQVIEPLGTQPRIASAAVDKASVDAALRWAVLLWPLRPDRDQVSTWLRSLRESTKFIDEVSRILRAASVLAEAAGFEARDQAGRDALARRLVVDAGPDLDRAIALFEASGTPVDDRLRASIAEVLDREGRAALRSPLDGTEVMEILGIEGRDVGDALVFLRDERVRRGPMEHSEAVEALERWWAAR